MEKYIAKPFVVQAEFVQAKVTKDKETGETITVAAAHYHITAPREFEDARIQKDDFERLFVHHGKSGHSAGF